ncbi:MAG: OmpA family protein [Candidatus Brocadiia bacterium]
MTKRIGLIVLVGFLGILGSGCISSKYRSQIKELQRQNEELELRNAKLESYYKELNQRNELLAKKLQETENDEEYYAQPVKNVDTVLIRKLESKGLEVIDREGNPAIIGTGLFNPGSATISADGKDKLDKILKVIKEETPAATISIDGYTDDQPVKESKYKTNEKLSLVRAEAVKTYFVEHKISEKRISTRGLGAVNPIADNKTPEGKQKNRRVEIVLLVNK